MFGCLDLRVPVDDDLGDVGQQLGGPILASRELKEFWRFVQEPSGKAPFQERRVHDQVRQEGDIGFDAPYAELLQGTFHPARRIHKAQTIGRHFDQQGIVKGCDDRA